MNYIIDLHCHTVASGHAYSTIQENVHAAVNKGLNLIGISDHGPAMPGGAPLLHFLNLKAIPKEINGIKVLKGAEVNIIDYVGSLDISNENLALLDYAIASLHPPCIKSGTINENTNAVINAIKNPCVKIIGHPDDNRFPLDYEKVVAAAKIHGTLLEVNNSSLAPDSFRPGGSGNIKAMLNICKKHKAKIILGSDAHFSSAVGEFSYCIELLKEVNFPEDLIINSSLKDLEIVLSK